LHALAVDESSESLADADRYFRAMRAIDNPQTNHANRPEFKRLLQRRPELAELKPNPRFEFVPDPEFGIGPPAAADLSQFPVKGK
jgi:hypothetical protein